MGPSRLLVFLAVCAHGWISVVESRKRHHDRLSLHRSPNEMGPCVYWQWMEDDGPSMVRRLRDGLRLVSTVVHAFAEPTSDYLQSLDAIARDVAEVIPDACVLLLRNGEQLSLIAYHDGSEDAAQRF